MFSTFIFVISLRYYCSVLLLLIAIVLTKEISGVDASVSSKSGGISMDNLVSSVMGVVNELGNVMKELRVGVDQVANGIQSVEDILDATFDEECLYQCPDGRLK